MPRMLLALLFLALPFPALAQTKPSQDAIDARLATTKFVLALEVPTGGFLPKPSDPRKDQQLPASLSATSAAVRTLKYLGAKVPNPEKHAAFVLSCLDPATGGFGDTPKAPPSVRTTAVGVMAAFELDIPRAKVAKAMEFLARNARTFEDVRIGAAAVEAWGLKDCPFQVEPWVEIALKHFSKLGFSPAQVEGARDAGSLAPFMLRMGAAVGKENMVQTMQKGQRPDGAWGNDSVKTSDLETTYRVMRGLHMLKSKPNDPGRVRAFLKSCRNPDGGYGVTPGEPSAIGPTYYATIVSHWLDGMEK